MRIFLTISLIMLSTVSSADPLEGISIEPEVDVENGSPFDYDRHLYKHWTDPDGDCQSERHEVLIVESLVPVTFKDKPGEENDTCLVETGLWHDPFTNSTFTNATQVQIDHLVPLKEVHQSGGHLWSETKREIYANDRSNPGHLIAVRGGTNGSKGFKDPAEWLPPNSDFHCGYVLVWTAIKQNWELSMDQDEADAIRSVLLNCE